MRTIILLLTAIVVYGMDVPESINQEGDRWDTVWSEITSGKRDLNSQDGWDSFLLVSQRQFKSNLFGQTETREMFARKVVDLTFKNDVNTPGLYESQMLLKYYPFKLKRPAELEVKHLKEDIMKPPEVRVMLRNLSVESLKTESAFEILADNDLFVRKSECKPEVLNHDDITVRSLANFLGDGAIDSEVDSTGRKLEGAKSAPNACLLAKVLHHLQSKPQLMKESNIPVEQLQHLEKKMMQASGTDNLMKWFQKFDNPYYMFEMYLLEHLRRLKVGESVYMLTGFTEHAMSLLIEKKSEDNYEIFVFNSGAGIEHHVHRYQGRKSKHFPAKRYSNLTLLALRWSEVFQRIAQVYSMSNGFATHPETKKPYSPLTEDLYIIALGVLEKFENPFTAEDIHRYKVIPSQRSGTCSVRNLLAFLAFDLRVPYRLLKLLIYKIIIKLALQKNWLSDERPTVNRLLKFGIENHARSILYFARKENSNINFDLKRLMSKNILQGYQQVKDAYREPKPTHFNVELTDAKTTKEPFDKVMERASEMMRSFSAALKSSSTIQAVPTEVCQKASENVFGFNFQTDFGSFSLYVSSLISFTSECRLVQESIESLMFLTTTVITLWPDATDTIWLKILDIKTIDKELAEQNLLKIWEMTRSILVFEQSSLKSNAYFYAALHKLSSILTFVFSQVADGIEDCRLFTVNKASLRNIVPLSGASHLVLSAHVMDYFRLHELPEGSDTETCIDLETKKPQGEFKNYANKIERENAHHYRDFTGEEKILAITTRRRSGEIPAIMYYWRLLYQIAAKLKSAEERGFNIIFPHFAEITFDPLNDSAIRSREDTKIFSWNISGSKTGALAFFLGSGALLESKAVSLSSYEPKIFKFVMRTECGQLERFTHLLMHSPQKFYWASTMYIGNYAAHREDSLNTLGNSLNNIREVVDTLRKTIYDQQSLFQKEANLSPELKRVCEAFSGLVIVESNIRYRLNEFTNLAARREEVYTILNFPRVHDSFSVFLSTAYLATFDYVHSSVEEAAKALAVYQKFVGIHELLPNALDKLQFVPQIKAKNIEAIYRLSKSPSVAKMFSSTKLADFIPNDNFTVIQRTDENSFIDLMAGIAISDGRLNCDIDKETAVQHYKNAGLNESINQLAFKSLRLQILDSYSQLITGEVQANTRKFTKKNVHYDLQRVELLIDDKTDVSIRETFNLTDKSGAPMGQAQGYRIPFSSLTGIPVPAPIEAEESYYTIAFPDQNQILFIDQQEEIWAENGLYSYSDSQLRNMRHLELAGTFTSPLSDNTGVHFYRNEQGKNFMLFKHYSDSNHKPLWFAQENGGWQFLNDRNYAISHDQAFSTAHTIRKHLVIQNQEMHKKLIVPFEHYEVQVATRSEQVAYSSGSGTPKKLPPLLKFDPKNAESRKEYIVLSLQKDSNKAKDQYLENLKRRYCEKSAKKSIQGNTMAKLRPVVKSRIEALILAYNHLITRNYEKAMSMMRYVHQIEPLKPKELGLLGWIVQSGDANKDGSPDGIAVRAYAAFNVFANNRLFQGIDAEKSHETAQEKSHDPYRKPEDWVKYWADICSGTDTEFIVRLIANYVRRRPKIPKALRFDPEENNGMVSQYEWVTWLQNYEDQHDSISRWLNPDLQPRFSDKNSTEPEKMEDFKLSSGEILACTKSISNDIGDCTIPAQLSFSNSEVLTSGKHLALGAILSGCCNEMDKARLGQYLHGFTVSSNQFYNVAGTLLAAISSERNNIEIELKTLMNRCDPTEYYSIARMEEDCVEQFNRFIEFLKPQESTFLRDEFNFRQFFKSKGAPVTASAIKSDPLNTKNIESNIFGVKFDIVSMKQEMRQQEESIRILIAKLLQDLSGKMDKKTYEDLYADMCNACKSASVADLLLMIRQLFHLYELNLMGEIITIVSKSSEDSSLMDSLKRLSEGEPLVSRYEVMHMFASADGMLYRRYFPHFDGDIQELHNVVTEYVLAYSNYQELYRLHQAYIDREKSPQKLKIELEDRVRSTNTTQTHILAYECHINSRLTKSQLGDTVTFTTKQLNGKYLSRMMQRIMSAGKSFIFGTLFSILKADGHHISILIVPKALRTGEAANLLMRTLGAFGISGFSFNVSRDPKLSTLENLEWLYHALLKAISMKQYIILSIEELLGMHNKLVELGLDESTQAEYDMLGKILELFEERGAATVDEAHQVFDPRVETNFPLTSARSDLNSDTLGLEAEALVEAYKLLLVDQDLIKSLGLPSIGKNIPFPEKKVPEFVDVFSKHILSALQQRKLKLSHASEEDWNSLNPRNVDKDRWNEKLLMFLYISAEKLNASDINFLKSHLSLNMYRALSVLRMAITEWIPLSWSGNVNENYGLSPTKKYSIPYAGAFAPKIGSEFAFRWFCYARTIRSYLVTGFDLRSAKWILTWLQKWALQELAETGIATGDTVPEHIFQTLFGLNSPLNIDLRSETQLEAALERLNSHHKTMIEGGESEIASMYTLMFFKWLAEDPIPSLEYYLEQISTNAQDASYMVDSTQLYSGSVVSVRAFPKELLDSQNVDLDETINPQIKEATVKHSPLPVLVIPPNLSAEQFLDSSQITEAIETMKNVYSSPAVALLDVGAYFKDQKNEEVALSLLQVQKSALYFSTDLNKLAFISAEDATEQILHTYSAEILQELFPDARQRITFYDQQHNTGVDIFQDDNGFAFVIIGLKTTAIDFYQAIMRMRKLLISQKIVVIVPENVCQAMGITNPTIEQVLEFLEKNQNEQVVSINAMSLAQIISAIYKKAVYKRILKKEIPKEALRIWIKSTASDIIEIVAPQRHRSFKEHIIPSLINHYEGLLKTYMKDKHLRKLRFEAETIVKMAFEGHSVEMPLYPDTRQVSDPNAEGESPSDTIAGTSLSVHNNDVDQVALATVESESNLLMEVETQATEYPLDEYRGHHGNYWDGDSLVIKRCPNREQIKKSFVDDLTTVNSWFSDIFKDHVGRQMAVPELFSPSLLITSGFIMSGALHGEHDTLIPHCLLLKRDDGEKFLVVITPYEARGALVIMKSGQKIFQCETCLVDPLTRNVHTRLGALVSKEEILAEFDSLITQSLIFGGYVKALAQRNFKTELDNWLMPGSKSSLPAELERAFKIAYVTDIAVGEKTMEKFAEAFPRKTSLIQYTGVSSKSLETVRSTFDLQALNLWTGNRAAISRYLATLQVSRGHGYLPAMLGIYSINREQKTIKESEIESIVFDAVEKYLADPESSNREDFTESMRAISKVTERASDFYMTRGAIGVMRNCTQIGNLDEYISTLMNMVNVLPNVEKNQSELFTEYLQALKSTELPKLSPRLFAFLLPSDFAKSSKDSAIMGEILNRSDFSDGALEIIKLHRSNYSKFLERGR